MEALVSILSRETDFEIVHAMEDVQQQDIEKVLESKPDVILMDIRFDGKKLGIDATSTIKQKLPATEIIIFTDYPDEDVLKAAIKAGASGFLLKNEVCGAGVIVDAIHAVYRGGGYITPSMTRKIMNVIKKSPNDSYLLTPRELQVLALLAVGRDNRKIAKVLEIKTRTVANHVSEILFKMRVNNRTEAAAKAREKGLIK